MCVYDVEGQSVARRISSIHTRARIAYMLMRVYTWYLYMQNFGECSFCIIRIRSVHVCMFHIFICIIGKRSSLKTTLKESHTHIGRGGLLGQ